MNNISQGEILSIENMSNLVLVISKDYFNRMGQVITAPIIRKSDIHPLHIFISTGDVQGYVLCEQMKLLDLRIRGYKKVSILKLDDIMNIVDAVQSIFDYYPYGG